MEYTKIPNVFTRETFGQNRLIEGSWSTPELEFLKDNDWVWTEKVDGCLHANTKLKLYGGGEITIGEVVEKRLPVVIEGYDGEKVVPTKIVAWHKNGLTDEWYVIKYDRRGLGTKGGNYYRTVTCTGNHRFYVDGEYKRADELSVGDKLRYSEEVQSLSYQQEQVIIGLIVGDGNVGDEGRAVEFSHKSSNEDYIEWLIQSLGNVGGNVQKRRKSGYGSEIIPARTISCTQIEELTSRFFENGKKIIPDDIELSPISLSVMYMDDGSLQRSEKQLDRCLLSLNDYDEASVDNLVKAFERQLHIYPVKLFSKGWILRFNMKEAEKVFALVAPYVCESMQYKLPEAYRGRFCGCLPECKTENVNKLREAVILGIEKKIRIHKRYDLTTETHNYFANGVLVHNCNIRVIWDGYRVSFAGRTDKATIPTHLAEKLNVLFGGPEKEELFEAAFGETPAILFGEGYGEKIQKGGGLYGPANFILFDVFCGSMWLRRDSVVDIASKLGIQTVPVVGHGTLIEGVEYIRNHPISKLRDAEMEGIVCRPAVELSDRRGNRVIVKIKCRDFPVVNKT